MELGSKLFNFGKSGNGGFEYKTSLVADQQPNMPALIESDYGEGIKIGTFENWRSTQYKNRESHNKSIQPTAFGGG